MYMSTRKQVFAGGEYYHLYNRGTDKRIIFKDKKDYQRFLSLMYLCNTHKNIELRKTKDDFERGETLIDLGAFCLMPNHFHILVKEKSDNGISKYMLKLLTAYSMYFNKKYKRTGSLYEGIFKSSHAGNDNYLKYLYSYIHLNPVKILDKNWRENTNRDNKQILDYVFDYQYSSLREYSNKKYRILNPAEFPSYFKESADHKKELLEWLNFEEAGGGEPSAGNQPYS